MPKDSLLFRFREKDSQEGISRRTLKKLSDVVDLSETAVMHRALVEYVQRHLPQYARDDGPLGAEFIAKISVKVRKRHGEVTVAESLFDESASEVDRRGTKRVPDARAR